eukprot:CAMPEP_0168461050 /NCGR_PEP_ID=MMETSP0228-20121227/53771_1 /TAXON_ID=133427 /ORGANISM="Protoceratium reticulatum, Strain CCCM 535 (=CCMP 1889)" /LENGTH=102 /DNA_ID=CAMNT_0008476325 /DNA_START=176 /DNA_END=481 /DNA_ORIENTATION=+
MLEVVLVRRGGVAHGLAAGAARVHELALRAVGPADQLAALPARGVEPHHGLPGVHDEGAVGLSAGERRWSTSVITRCVSQRLQWNTLKSSSMSCCRAFVKTG